MESKIVAVFDHKGLAGMKISGSLDISHKFQHFHNGYVQALESSKGQDYDSMDISTEELTFGDTLDRRNAKIIKEGTFFFGFDTAHMCDNALTQTFQSVKERTKKLADEMIWKGI